MNIKSIFSNSTVGSSYSPYGQVCVSPQLNKTTQALFSFTGVGTGALACSLLNCFFLILLGKCINKTVVFTWWSMTKERPQQKPPMEATAFSMLALIKSMSSICRGAGMVQCRLLRYALNVDQVYFGSKQHESHLFTERV